MSGASTTVRPMTEPERKAELQILKNQKNNVLPLAFFSIVMSVFVNFVSNIFVLILSLLCGLGALFMSMLVRKGAKSIGKVLANGTVTEFRVVPTRASPRTGWQFGMYSTLAPKALKGMLTDGVPASFAVKMENAHLLAVNGTPLRWPILLRLVPGAAMPPAAPAVAEQVPIAAPMTVDQELPPPQEDGVGQLLCANCGAENPAGARFCNTCGAPLVNDIEPTDENPSDENPTDDN